MQQTLPAHANTYIALQDMTHRRLTSLSIVIPAYNEEQRIGLTLQTINEFLLDQCLEFAEIIVVDDGSRDKTVECVERYRQEGIVLRVLRNPGNRGKGYAVRHGVLNARGEWVLFSDADLSTPIDELHNLYRTAEVEDASVVIGSRALNRSLVAVHQSPLREFSGIVFNRCMRLLSGLPFQDTQCGFKLFQCDAAKAVFSRQKLDGFSFDVEALYLAHRLRYRTVEVPVRWSNAPGTKVSLWSGVQSFLDLLRIRRYHS